MRKTSELKFLRTIKTGKGLIKLINSLKTIRRREKVKGKKRSSLTKKQRELILSKTDSRCHMCGVKVDITISRPIMYSRTVQVAIMQKIIICPVASPVTIIAGTIHQKKYRSF